MVKNNLLKAGEGYFSRTLVELETNINKLSKKHQSYEESIELESLERKKLPLTLASLSLVLKLQYL